MNKSGIFVFFLSLFLLGAWIAVSWFGLGYKDNQYKNFFGRKVILQGYVVSDPEVFHFHGQRFQVRPIVNYDQDLAVTTFRDNSINYGDKIYLIGKIKEPKNFDDFDYVRNLRTKNIYAQISSPDIFVIGKSHLNPIIFYSLKIKHFVFDKFRLALPPEQAALLIAIVVGQKDLMPTADIDAFRATGTSHLIALSGYVLTLMMIILGNLEEHIGRRNTYLLCLFTAIVYLVMSNFATGIVRAAIMSLVFTVCKLNHRQYQMLPSLALTASILVAFNPLIIKYDIGFMLSFISIIGIIYFVPIIKYFLGGLGEKIPFKNIIVTTISAQLVTTPLIVFYFKELSLIALPANLMVLPMLEPVLALAYFICIPLVGFPFAKIMLVIMNYILLTVLALGHFKYAAIYVNLGSIGLVGIYIAEILLYLLILRWLKKRGLSDKLPR
ncbi:MAG: hypothetical protein NVSMB66_5850 [Candidatus Doudnabacteria bacterium]